MDVAEKIAKNRCEWIRIKCVGRSIEYAILDPQYSNLWGQIRIQPPKKP